MYKAGDMKMVWLLEASDVLQLILKDRNNA